jgi:hypothetical protein
MVFFLGTLNQQVEHVDINSDAILDLVFLDPLSEEIPTCGI